MSLPSGPGHGIVRAAMTRRPVRTLSLAATLAAVLAACATVETAPGTPPSAASAAAPRKVLQGSVLYREKAALPADAQVKVQLVDAKADPPAVIAETVFGSAGRQVPLPFALPLEASRVEPGRSYALRAYIAFGGQTRYVTTTRVSVDPSALPEVITILVVPGGNDPVVTDSAPPPGAMKPVAPSRSTLPRGSGRTQPAPKK